MTISPSLAVPPTPHLPFSMRPSSLRSSSLPTNPVTSVTCLPARRLRSIHTRRFWLGGRQRLGARVPPPRFDTGSRDRSNRPYLTGFSNRYRSSLFCFVNPPRQKPCAPSLSQRHPAEHPGFRKRHAAAVSRVRPATYKPIACPANQKGRSSTSSCAAAGMLSSAVGRSGRTVRRLRRRGRRTGRRAVGSSVHRRAGPFGASAQHLHVIGYDFGRIALVVVLIGPFPRAQAAFDIDLAALADIPVGHVGQSSPQGHRYATRYAPWFPASGDCRSARSWRS